MYGDVGLLTIGRAIVVHILGSRLSGYEHGTLEDCTSSVVLLNLGPFTAGKEVELAGYL